MRAMPRWRSSNDPRRHFAAFGWILPSDSCADESSRGSLPVRSRVDSAQTAGHRAGCRLWQNHLL